ncbi:Rab3 GTPase-activating protein catalytic subunit-domain-containing protein [Jimgerdemannia flammicorona]|uniref:Rab3 GTPase-activating protein catalytic subunit n=1 Tax=Jimgerdemannia flammicorona TaxID=994334 RepID=A0A433D8W3_9FUNG|nr:Rab3 GTPase-activating protein catalytic subunit-domain-containing protein [Jimgerdemannia flammicorona]
MATLRFTPRRTTSAHSDELFEFVDYTSASHFERFTTSVEEVLSIWGVKDGQHGIYVQDQFENVAGKNLSQSQLTGDLGYSQTEIISIDDSDSAYALTYHYHPGGRAIPESKDASAEGDSRYRRHFACDDFLSSTLPEPTTVTATVPNPTFHALHRWTGLSRLFVLAPANPPDIFKPSTSSNTIDIHTAKLLISACAMAFHNTGCTVPVFVQTGQHWSSLFTGYMLANSRGVDATAESDEGLGWTGCDIEVRFNTAVVPFVPAQFSHLQGLTEMFREKLGSRESDYGSASWCPPAEIAAAGLITYNLKNWFEEDWKRFDDDGLAGSIVNDDEDLGSPLSPEDDFLNGFAQSDSLSLTLKLESQPSETAISAPPSLPFGPLNDPLRSLTLLAQFPFAPSDAYQDYDNPTEMDALLAKNWTLRCEIAPQNQQRAFLAEIIEQAVSSWIKDPSNKEYLAPYDEGNREESPTRPRPDRDLGNLRNFVNAVSQARSTPGGIAMVDTADVESVLQALFEQPSSRSSSDIYYHGERFITSRHSDISLSTARALGFHFRHGSVAPYRSLLWNLLLHALNTLSPNSKMQYSSTFIGFLKILWTEVMRRIRWHWDHLELIPDVGVHTMSRERTGAGSAKLGDNSATVKPKISREVGIDLRFNMLHQKLAMINCCILREQQSQKRTGNGQTTSSLDKTSTSLTPAPSMKGAIKNLFDPFADSMPQLSPTERFGRVARFIEKFVEGDNEDHPPQSYILSDAAAVTEDSGKQVVRSASPAIPMKDKSQSVRRPNGALCYNVQFSRNFCLMNPSGSAASTRNIPSSMIDDSDEDSELFFDSIDDAGIDLSSDAQAQRQKKKISKKQRPLEARAEVISPSSLSQNSDVSDAQPYSLGDSYVRLNLSVSLEAAATEPGPGLVQQGQLQMTRMPEDDEEERDLEVMGEDESEGQVCKIEGVTLSRTGESMWLPDTQNTGFMTEDMLKQQAEVFESLGTSSDAAKIRAKMQSEHLVSDMQAFKAANPHAVMEDFVRWHSPRDWIVDVDDDGNTLSTGKLSIRMSEPGNLWQELWKVCSFLKYCSMCKIVPFSCSSSTLVLNLQAIKAGSGESTKTFALHYLESMSVYEVFSQTLMNVLCNPTQRLLPTISLIAYDTLVSHPVAMQAKPVASGLLDLAKTLISYPWDELRSVRFYLLL